MENNVDASLELNENHNEIQTSNRINYNFRGRPRNNRGNNHGRYIDNSINSSIQSTSNGNYRNNNYRVRNNKYYNSYPQFANYGSSRHNERNIDNQRSDNSRYYCVPNDINDPQMTQSQPRENSDYSKNRTNKPKPQVKNKNYDRSQRFQNKQNYNQLNNLSRRNESIKDKVVKPKSELETVEMNQRDSLIWQLTHAKYECMICVSNIRTEAATWSCNNCFHIFHIGCIRKWADTCENSEEGLQNNARCPACQKQLSQTSSRQELSSYRCFCGKMDNPVYKRGQVPHSCSDVCGKLLTRNFGVTEGEDDNYCYQEGLCRHLCGLLCHPGPCPPCEASVTRNCHCGRARITAKCNADTRTLVCDAQCDKLLNCRLHRCDNTCHAGACAPCQVSIDQWCPCDKHQQRSVICGSEEWATAFVCGEPCGRLLECNNHHCPSTCHDGPCEPCPSMPTENSTCWCGKSNVRSLLNGHNRQSCLDPVPSCGQPCGKLRSNCGHKCETICHEGNCDPCPLDRDLSCRCGKSVQMGVKCASLESTVVMCSSRCSQKLLCGRHRCNERCCNSDLHLCLQQCGRLLTCGTHHCERECGHPGLCPTCHNVSFDELHCECGATTTLPPIACGQNPPTCQELCSRDHGTCGHPVRHNCHSDISCPPCTELISKYCPGQHKLLDNIPCFRPVVTCGLVCGRPLDRCDHSCNRLCHEGQCIASGDRCEQPCPKARHDCGHACEAPCHYPEECQIDSMPCQSQISLTCPCKLRSINITCCKLQMAISLMKFNNYNAKRDNVELTISPIDGSASLPCDNECRKVARHVQLAQAFDIPTTISTLNTYYPDSFKIYAKKNIEFTLMIEKILVDLAKNVKNITDIVYTHTMKSLCEDRADFVTRYASCFKFTCKCSLDQARKQVSVIIEVNRSKCCLAKPLLSDVLRSECPSLFPTKPDEERVTSSSINVLTMSFADRIRLSKK